MLKLLRIFSQYVDPFEKKVDKFFRGVKSTDSFNSIRKKLLKLMQENLIVVNVWLEKKYKGYKYLSKGARRKMYSDVNFIVAKFEEHRLAHAFSVAELKERLSAQKLHYPSNKVDELQYLAQIMSFLHPGKHYHYIKTASFGKLLRDPRHAKLEGDCNQIVTLYIYLYSLHYPLSDLEIKLLPEHVCLHFNGIDIEATTGRFKKYDEYDHILPVSEIISTNLLDLADFREKVQSVSARDMLKSSQLAYAISSLKTVVTKNLEVAYRNLAVSSMESGDFDTALFYAAKAGDTKLLKTIKHNQGVVSFKKGSIDKAIRIFTELGDNQMLKACYSEKYNKLVATVRSVKTLADAKNKKSTYKKMLELARKMGDRQREKHAEDILKQI